MFYCFYFIFGMEGFLFRLLFRYDSFLVECFRYCLYKRKLFILSGVINLTTSFPFMAYRIRTRSLFPDYLMRKHDNYPIVYLLIHRSLRVIIQMKLWSWKSGILCHKREPSFS